MGEGGGRREGVVEGERGWVGKGERVGEQFVPGKCTAFVPYEASSAS